MQATTRTRTSITALSTVLVATVLIAGATLVPTREAPVALRAANSETTVPNFGVPSGGFENGIPVHRLPTITVVASRSAELARMAQEEKLAMK
jgi:hypothetical protein